MAWSMEGVGVVTTSPEEEKENQPVTSAVEGVGTELLVGRR